MTSLIPQGHSRYLEKRLPAIDRAFDLLELLAGAARSFTLSEISRRLQIPKSSTYYLIHTLVTRGYVRQTPNGRDYFLGKRLDAILGGKDFCRVQLRMICAPYLRKLALNSALTAQVAIREGSEGIIVSKVSWPTNSNTGFDIDRHFDLHCTALGKTLIVNFRDSEIERLFQSRGLPRHNENTIFSLKALELDLAEVRAKGYAINNEEHTVGTRAIAAPLTNHSAQVIAAIGLHGPTGRLPLWRTVGIGTQLVSTAREISSKLPCFGQTAQAPGLGLETN